MVANLRAWQISGTLARRILLVNILSANEIIPDFKNETPTKKSNSQDTGEDFNSHPSALPHLYHSIWQLIAQDPFIMNFKTLNLI